jgi:hypothetical protein
MAMLLQYEVGVVGLQTLARAQRSIESGFAQHQRRLNRIVGAGGGSARAGASPAAASRRELEKSHQAAMRLTTQHAKAQQSAVASLDRQRSRALYQQHRELERLEKRKTRLIEAEAKQQMRARQRFTDGAFGKVSGSVRGTLGAVGRLGGAAMGLAGGFAAVGAVQERIRDTKIASQLANQAGNPALKAGLLKESRGVKGFTSEQILGGVGEFVTKTGDLDTGRQFAGSQAKLSLATGANFEDLMATAGQAFNVLKDQISDPVERIRQLNGLMGVLAQQGALGAVEIKDLAQDFGKLGAATRGFEGKAPDLLRTMGAFAQVAVARGGAESSADASTAASRLVGDIVTHKKKFAALGVGIQSKSDATKLANPMDIIADTLDKTKGDVMKTSGLFGLESGKIFKGFAATYSEAEKKKKGSGRGAVMAEYNRFAGAELSDKDITARANSRLDDPDLRLQETMKSVNAAMADKLLPVVMRLVPEFEKLLPYVEQGAKRFAQMAEAFAQDPLGGLMRLAAAKLAFDVAASSAADSGKKLASALSGAASGVSGATGGGLGGAGLLGAQLGLSVATMVVTASVVNFEKGEADMTAGGQDLARMRELQARAAAAKAGVGAPLTAAELAESRDIQVKQGKREAATKTPGMGQTILDMAISSVMPSGATLGIGGATSKVAGDASLTSPNKSVEVKTQESFTKEMNALKQSIDALTSATRASASNAGGGPGTPPNRGNAPSPVKG